MRNSIHKAVTAVATTKHGLALEILILFALPLFLVRVLPAIIHIRHLVMAASLLYIYLLIKTAGLTGRQMGLSLARLGSACMALALPTFLIILTIYLLSFRYSSLFIVPAFSLELRHLPLWSTILGYTLISVPLQELIFRAFYLPRLELLTKNRLFLVTFSAILFMIAHIPFQNMLLVLTTGILGVVWAENFLKYRSLPAIILSHALVGIAMWLQMYGIFG